MPNRKSFKSTKTKSRPRLSQRGGRKSTKSKSLSKKVKRRTNYKRKYRNASTKQRGGMFKTRGFFGKVKRSKDSGSGSVKGSGKGSIKGSGNAQSQMNIMKQIFEAKKLDVIKKKKRNNNLKQLQQSAENLKETTIA